jgi:hypothetical protein
MHIAVWQIVDNKPVRATRGVVGLERDLESWIERDPERSTMA